MVAPSTLNFTASNLIESTMRWLKSAQVLFVENGLCFNKTMQSHILAERPATSLKNWTVSKFCRIQSIVQTLLHLSTVSSDQCSTLWKVADWSHSTNLKKHVKNFSIQSRRTGTLTKSESLQIIGRRSWTMMLFILKNSCCSFWINSCIENHYFNTAHELFPQPNIFNLCVVYLFITKIFPI